jgi:S1-C subfamily serine protease
MRRILAGLMVLVALFALTASGCVYININSTPTPIPTQTPVPINQSYVPPELDNSSQVPNVPDFISMIEKVRPSVVAIDVTTTSLDIFGGKIPQKGAGSG